MLLQAPQRQCHLHHSWFGNDRTVPAVTFNRTSSLSGNACGARSWRAALYQQSHEISHRRCWHGPRRHIIAETFADPVMEAPEVEDEEDRRWDPTNLSAVVVGAGPTGALATHYLAIRGYRVDIFDKGPRPSPGDAASIPLVLTSRGAIAFEELGLDGQRRVGPTATPLRGVWDVVGRRLRTVDSTSAFRRTFVTDRSGLAADLIEAAEQRYPDKVRFHFNTEMIRAELKNRVVGVRPSGAAGHTATTPTADSAPGEGSPGAPADQDAARTLEHDLEVPYDLLIGADGTESTVRRILKAKVKDFSVLRPVQEAVAYKRVRQLPRPAVEPLPGFFTHRPQEYVYDWSGPNKPSVRLFIDADCGVSGTVAGLQHWDDGGQAAKELLAAYPHGVFPREWADEIGRQVASPASVAPGHAAILQCSQFHGPRAVLLGDAVHAVTGASGPLGLGQGASAAVESVRTLALVLRGAQDDLDKVPEVFSNVRGDAVMAMQMLEFMELTRDPDRVRQIKFASWWYWWSATVTQVFRWLAEMVGGLLSSLMPKTFLSAPQVLARLEDRRIGYSEVVRMLQGYASPVVALVVGGIFVALFVAFSKKLGL